MKSAQRKLKTLGPEQVMYHCCQETYELAITFPVSTNQHHNYRPGSGNQQPERNAENADSR